MSSLKNFLRHLKVVIHTGMHTHSHIENSHDDKKNNAQPYNLSFWQAKKLFNMLEVSNKYEVISRKNS